jgi:hypothetical protein
MFRNILDRGLASGVDSPFVYALLPFFASHNLHAFSVWLPEPFGQVQQFSIYWLLAALQAIISNPAVLYDIALLAGVLLVSGAMYCFAYWLSRSPVAAGIGAAMYTLSPFLVAQLLAGHLDVIVAYGIGPLTLWCGWAALRAGRVSAMIGAGLCASVLFLLTTGQGAYWALPLAIICIAEIAAPIGSVPRRQIAARACVLGGVGITVFLCASAVEIVPTLAGQRAPFAGSGQRYAIQDIAIHAKYSLPLADNILGIPRELYLDPSMSLAAAPFSSWPYRLVALLTLTLSFVALGGRLRRSAATMFAPIPIAWLIASGPNGPFPELYSAYYTYVPYASLLRVPNRWLMVSTASLAVLTALTIAASPTEKIRALQLTRRMAARTAVVLTLFMATFALLHGLPSWSPPAADKAAYAPIDRTPGDWRVLTTPYYQSWMNALPGSDLTLQADLGTVSSWWHRHAVLGRGGWDTRAARFALYLDEVVEQGTNRDLSKLLGAVAVKYIALYPEDPLEVDPGQNAFFRAQHFLTLISSGGGIQIYRNDTALPQAYITKTSCVVAGGLHVLGDLAQQSWFSFRQTGVEFADQLVAVGGKGMLRDELARSRCLILAPGGASALTVLLHASERLNLSGIAPAAWIGSPTSPSLDIGAEPSYPVEVPRGGSLAGTFRLSQAGTYRVWVAGLHDPEESGLRVEVDGRAAGAIRLTSTVGSGFTWSPAPSVRLAAGIHRFRLRVVANGGSARAQLTQLAVVPVGVGIASDIPRDHVRVLREVGGTTPFTLSSFPLVGRWVHVDWKSAAPARVEVVQGARGSTVVTVRRGDRPYYTIARGAIVPPSAPGINPNALLALRFKGTGSGQRIYVNFAYTRAGAPFAGFSFVDDTTRTRTILLSPQQPSFVHAVPNWQATRAVMLATSSKRRLRRPLIFLGLYALRHPALLPSFVNSKGLRGGKRQAPAVAALGTPTEMVSAEARLKHHLPKGLLVFTQSYHAGWRLEARAHAPHIVVLGFANGYRLPRRTEVSALVFEPAMYGRIGSYLSLAAWLSSLGVLGLFLRRERRARQTGQR